MGIERSQNTLWHGVDAAPSLPQWLLAGPVAVALEEGQLRGIYANGREVVRRIYGAVRDRYWNTVPGVLSGMEVEQRADGFRVAFTSTHVSAEVDFVWRGEISGDVAGTVRYAFTGEARCEMLKNRVGLCLLLPVTLAGSQATVEYVSGDAAEVTFPVRVDPMQPVRGLHDFRALTFPAGDGLEVKAVFEGDVFEIEDQRNWTDASYKAYSTPQRIPMPAKMRAGQKVGQAVTLALTGGSPPPAAVSGEPETIEIALGSPCGKLPALGVGMASHGLALTTRELDRLRALQPGHYRLEVDFAKDGWQESFARGLGEAEIMQTGVEAVLILSDAAASESEAAAEIAVRFPGRVTRWLILTKGQPATHDLTLADAREALAGAGGLVGGGTDADFFQLNNNRPEAGLMDFVSVPLRPCAHQFDRATLAENLEGQRAVLESLAALYPGLPRSVSPVSFRTRAQKGPAAGPGELPAQADVRQMSLLGAAWTVGCIKAVAESGVTGVTLFQTTGLRGIMEVESGSTVAEFLSVPGGVYPVYHVLASLAGWQEANVIQAVSASPHVVEALVLEKAGRVRTLLANYSPLPRRVLLHRAGVADFAAAEASLWDATNALASMCDPEAPVTCAPLVGGVVELPPFAFARVDWPQS